MTLNTGLPSGLSLHYFQAFLWFCLETPSTYNRPINAFISLSSTVFHSTKRRLDTAAPCLLVNFRIFCNNTSGQKDSKHFPLVFFFRSTVLHPNYICGPISRHNRWSCSPLSSEFTDVYFRADLRNFANR